MDYNKTFNKYIIKNSFHRFGQVHKKPTKQFYNRFIIIPCYSEYNYLFKTLDSINNQNKKLMSDCLVVIVINNHQEDPHDIKTNNNKTFFKLVNQKFNFEFITIDCFSKKNMLNKKLSGVGVARKIGLDYCLLYAKDKKSLFCSLDADSLIAKNYISKINSFYRNKNFGAAVVNFRHQKSKDKLLEAGIRKYEKELKKAAKNIHNTGSPYGYVSMGSTIICNAESYIAARGMPKKNATEDFYFLQALAKHTKIEKINDILVYPSPRDDQRVYLGTGYRMKEYKENKIFKNLSFSNRKYKVIKNIILLVKTHSKNDFKHLKEKLDNHLDQKSVKFLLSKGLENTWNQINQNSTNKKQFMLFFHQWFDGLKVIQFLKQLS